MLCPYEERTRQQVGGIVRADLQIRIFDVDRTDEEKETAGPSLRVASSASRRKRQKRDATLRMTGVT